MISGVAPVRGPDPHGSGEWGAPRGQRKHRGVDFVFYPKTKIKCPIMGECTKIGHPYGDDLSFKYVQITDDKGRDHRFFYLDPLVKVGDQILVGDFIGEVQDLTRRYNGIQSHVHYELKRNGHYLNPLLESQ